MPACFAMPGTEALHQILSGIANGGIYASVALALVMIYQSTHHINFAQGEMAMFSTYIAWALMNAGVPYWVAFVGVFIGMLLIFNSIAGWIFSYTLKPFPSPFGEGPPVLFGLFSRHEL